MADMSLDEALGLTGAEAADDSIHIDVNTRQVTVPESQQLFGVESDENVEVKHIVLDGRYNDGTDLSALTLRVNWRNANGGKGSYLVTNLDVTEDSIAFDWVISRGVVAYKGTVYFIVCAFKVNSTGKKAQEWNSSLGQGTVLEGLEVTDEDIGGDDTVNRMLTILQQMNSVQTAAKNSADAAAASNKSASDTAGSIKDSLDQIAENKAAVSQLKENTAKLKDGKISKFYASSQGNTNLPDSDDGRIMDLKLYGKSSQDGTPTPDNPVEIKSVVNPVVKVMGKNLLKPMLATSTKSGVTCTANSDGTYTLNGTATATAIFVLCRNFDFAGKAMLCGGTSLANLQYSNSVDFAYGDTGSGVTVEHFDGKKYPNASFNILIESGTVYKDEVVKPMMTTDMSATYDDYMPYTEQTATLPYTLNAIPVSSGGNVTIDGQQYIADYVDVEKGKLVMMVDSSKLDTTQSIIGKTDWLLATPTETDLTADEIAAFKSLVSHYPVTNVSTTSDQLDGYTVFDYPISLANGWNYVKQQLGDTRDYLYGIDLMTAEAYVNSEYAAALAEIEV